MMRNFCNVVYDGLICNYFNFRHRTPLEVFLPFMLFILLCSVPSVILFCMDSKYAIWTAGATGTILLCPTLGIMVRRLHDTAESGMALCTIFGAIAFISLLFWFESERLPVMSDYEEVSLFSEERAVLILFGIIITGVIAILIWKLTRPTAETYTPWDYSEEYPYPPLRGLKNRYE